MIEIKFKDNIEVADIAGSTVEQARAQYKKDLHIADKATAFLNGKKIKPAAEAATVLKGNDSLSFKVSHGNRLVYLAGTLLLAMAISGGVFAYGFINSTTTISASIAESNFAEVSANTTVNPSWTIRGMQKGQTGSGTLFDINTQNTGFTGDFTATITVANLGELAKVYRSLDMVIEVRDAGNNLVDIDGDGNPATNSSTLLTLQNATVILNITQASTTQYTIMLKNGYYKANAHSGTWTTDQYTPMLYCELGQR